MGGAYNRRLPVNQRSPWRASPSKTASCRCPTVSSLSCSPPSARDVSAGAQITVDRDRDKNPVVALREIAETKLDQAVLKDSLISGMQKHADIDKPEEVNEMAELEQELAAALAQGGAEAAQPKALPMAEEDDITE